MNLKFNLFIAFFLLSLASCGDKPVTYLPERSKIVGTWECLDLPKRTEKVIGNVPALGHLHLADNGSFSVKSFPMSDPLRLVDRHGHWELLEAAMTPSGACSVELDGVFLSLRQRGDRLILYYPIDVIEGYYAEYTRKD